MQLTRFKSQWSKPLLSATFKFLSQDSGVWDWAKVNTPSHFPEAYHGVTRCPGIGKTMTLEEAEPVLLKALELGCTFWDTAIIYGIGMNEKLIGDFLKKHNARDKVFIASKCGVDIDWEARVPKGIINTPASINESIEGTISRLQTTPDLYYLHRRDLRTPLEESIPALATLRTSGETKYIVRFATKHADPTNRFLAVAKIDAVQSEYSLFETVHETSGVLETAKDLGITFVAYRPLGTGFLTGKLKSAEDMEEHRRTPKFTGDNFARNFKMVDALKVLAAKKGVSSGQVAIAWVAAQGCLPIPGTKDAGRLAEDWVARDVEFTEEELPELRRLTVEAKSVGERYSPGHQVGLGNCSGHSTIDIWRASPLKKE